MFNRNRQFSRNRFAGRSGGNGGGFGRAPQRRKLKTLDLHPSAYINKPAPQAEEIKFQAKHQFADFEVNELIKANIALKGYNEPTPIQDEVIPLVLEGKDVVGMANTGTGKTAAFLIPLLNKIMKDRNQRVLVLAPTRELAVQIQEEARTFSYNLNIFSVLCIGGVSMQGQIQGLRRNPNIVIGTPGRIKDLKNQGKLFLDRFNNVVLDEVDRMLDMGFIHDMKYILSFLPQARQSMFFSATMPPAVGAIINSFSKNAINVSVKTRETASQIDQDIVKLNGRQKIEVLHEILIREEVSKTIVFGRTKWGIEKLAKELERRGFKAVSLHGNKSQGQRQRAMDMFKDNRAKVLLATDIAARGLDIDDVSHVINYDLPESYDDYVHRVGRTGRNNKRGFALTLID